MDQSGGKRDIEWINAAKGLTILLVILGHAAHYTLAIRWDDQATIEAVWGYINNIFQPARMPLFFLVSGILASTSVKTPREDTQHKRLTRPIYLYFLWGVLLMVIMPFDPAMGPVPRDLIPTATRIITVGSSAWYFLGLAIFYCLARVTLHWSNRKLMILAALLSIYSSLFEQQIPGHIFNLLRCAIFFLAGVRFKSEIMDFVASYSPRKLAYAALAFLVAVSITAPLDIFFVASDIAAVIFALFLVKYIADNHRRATAFLSYLGRRTIGIYVFHFVAVSYLILFLMDYYRAYIVDSLTIGLIFPLIIWALALPISLALYEGSRALGLTWLFEVPRMPAVSRAFQRLKGASGDARLSGSENR